MPETHKGPTPAVGDKLTPQETQQNRTPGSDQQHSPGDENPTPGVTQGHHSPQQEKQGHGHGGSSTGLPQGEDSRNPSSDHNPRTQESHGGDAHSSDVSSKSHTGSTADRS